MKHLGFMALAMAIVSAVPACAEQWSKTYNISGTPELRVETSDANIHVDTWDHKTIEATVLSDHYKIGAGGLQILEHHSGDVVEINVRFPHEFHIGSFSSRRVDINVHMPRKGRLTCTPAMEVSTSRSSVATWS